MNSYCALLLNISVGAIADFVRNSSQTGVLVGVGSVFLIFGAVLRRHLPIHEDQSSSQEFVVWKRLDRLDRHAGVPVRAPNPIVLQGNIPGSHPALFWESTMPPNRYIGGLDSASGTTATRGRSNVA